VVRHVVCSVDELPPGGRHIVEVAGRSIGVFNVGGRYYALRNRCPHHGAPLCRGKLTGLVTGPEPYQYHIEREGEILRCPWHGWEFDVTTGRSVFNPHRVGVKRYDVTLEPASPPPSPGAHQAGEHDDPSIETYAVSIEQRLIVVHVEP